MRVNEALIGQLQQVPVFGGIDAASLSFLLASSPERVLRAGEYFFREGDDATSMFVLTAGEALVIKHWHGCEHAIHPLGVGDCFGEMALMDMFPRSASIRAEQDCRAVEIVVHTLGELYARDAEQFTIIMMNLGREICRRLRESDERLFRERLERERGAGGSAGGDWQMPEELRLL